MFKSDADNSPLTNGTKKRNINDIECVQLKAIVPYISKDEPKPNTLEEQNKNGIRIQETITEK